MILPLRLSVSVSVVSISISCQYPYQLSVSVVHRLGTHFFEVIVHLKGHFKLSVSISILISILISISISRPSNQCATLGATRVNQELTGNNWEYLLTQEYFSLFILTRFSSNILVRSGEVCEDRLGLVGQGCYECVVDGSVNSGSH